MKYYSIILLAIFFMSCKQKDKRQTEWESIIKQNVDYWTTHSFKYPKNLRVLNDSTHQYENDTKKPYHLIVYTEGTCGVCVENLHFWSKLIKDADIEHSKCSMQMFIFTFDPDFFQKNTITKLNIKFPWISDKDQQCIALNHMDDKRFQALIINSHNKPILLGNPVLNPALRKLYISTIKSLKDSVSR